MVKLVNAVWFLISTGGIVLGTYLIYNWYVNM